MVKADESLLLGGRVCTTSTGICATVVISQGQQQLQATCLDVSQPLPLPNASLSILNPPDLRGVGSCTTSTRTQVGTLSLKRCVALAWTGSDVLVCDQWL